MFYSRKGGLLLAIDELFRKIDAAPQLAYATEEETVAAGFGIAIVPELPVLQCLDAAVLPITGPDTSRTACLYRRKDARKAPAYAGPPR